MDFRRSGLLSLPIDRGAKGDLGPVHPGRGNLLGSVRGPRGGEPVRTASLGDRFSVS